MAEDAANFSTVQIAIAFILIAALVLVAAFWETLAELFRSKKDFANAVILPGARLRDFPITGRLRPVCAISPLRIASGATARQRRGLGGVFAHGVVMVPSRHFFIGSMFA